MPADKECRVCYNPITTRNKSGLCTTCWEIDYQKKYREKHKKEAKKYNKKYREKNREKLKEQQKAYQIKNKETIDTYKQAWYEKNKEKILVERKVYRKKKASQRLLYNRRIRFGLSKDKIEDLYKLHDNRCAICGKTEQENKRALSIDHDHNTEEIRGLLCNNCNIGIGNLQDNPQLLLNAYIYLTCGNKEG